MNYALTPPSADPVAVVADEIRLELQYLPIALTLDIDLLLGGVKFQRFTSKYARFAKDHPTPTLLIQGERHAQAFAEGIEEDLKEAAVIYALSQVWKAKAAERQILRPEVADQYATAKLARDQRVGLHVAVARLAKGQPDDSFAAGLRVNVTQVCREAAALQLAELTAKAEPERLQ
jgi:hypothetical protein